MIELSSLFFQILVTSPHLCQMQVFNEKAKLWPAPAGLCLQLEKIGGLIQETDRVGKSESIVRQHTLLVLVFSRDLLTKYGQSLAFFILKVFILYSSLLAIIPHLCNCNKALFSTVKMTPFIRIFKKVTAKIPKSTYRSFPPFLSPHLTLPSTIQLPFLHLSSYFCTMFPVLPLCAASPHPTVPLPVLSHPVLSRLAFSCHPAPSCPVQSLPCHLIALLGLLPLSPFVCLFSLLLWSLSLSPASHSSLLFPL